MVKALYVVTLLSSVVAGLVLVFGFAGAASAPQEAAAAALALALAVVPYVFTRSVQLSNDYSARREFEQKVLELLHRSIEIAERTNPR
jgi:hypothetical protein